MKFDTDYIEKLADILNAKGLTEISVKDGNQAVALRKEVVASVAAPVVAAAAPSAAPSSEPEKKGKPIVSPMVGTFYKSPSPDAEPFVEVGKAVAKGDVVCIVEAMKLMNEIKSEQAGKVVKICVKNGDPVEFGQVLMYVE